MSPCALDLAAASQRSVSWLELVGLRPLMERTVGASEVRIALLDGPVLINHPDLAADRIRAIPSGLAGTCSPAGGPSCRHGTFVAGVLSARRESRAPAICPGCTLLVRPIFGGTPISATAHELGSAIVDAVEAGASVINISAAIAGPVARDGRHLREALTFAARHAVIVVAAAGNDGRIGGSVLLDHPWVIPVGACDRQGLPLRQSNLGRSIGWRGVGAPGDGVESLSSGAGTLTLGGTSAAAPFVTGTVALLLSEFPDASPARVMLAVTQGAAARRRSVAPRLLNAWSAYQLLARAPREEMRTVA